MPFYPPFNMPFFYNNYMHHRNSFNATNSSSKNGAINSLKAKEPNSGADFNYKTSYQTQKQNTSSYNQVQKQNTFENYYKQKASENYNKQEKKASENYNKQEKKASENSENSENRKSPNNHEIFKTSEAFFEIFGLKLYFDDILIMCILFFLYTEKVHDDELFICLILLLLT